MRVSFVSNAAQLGVMSRRRIEDLMPALRASEEESGRIMEARARELSSGAFSTADLRRLGHPYRIGGAPPANPAIINAQSRVFYGSWKHKTELRSNTVSLFVFNDAPWAKYMLGTSKMIARPILERLVKLEGPARFKRLRSAFGIVMQRK